MKNKNAAREGNAATSAAGETKIDAARLDLLREAVNKTLADEYARRLFDEYNAEGRRHKTYDPGVVEDYLSCCRNADMAINDVQAAR
jgi:hypothetical protein